MPRNNLSAARGARDGASLLWHGITRGPPDVFGFGLPDVTPVNEQPPVISGIGYTNYTLTATPGVWSNASSVTGVWQADGITIVGATSLTYVVTPETSGRSFQYVELAQPRGIFAQSNTLHNWTPADTTTALWVDPSNPATITVDENNRLVTSVNLANTSMSLSAPETGTAPLYNDRTINGLSALKFGVNALAIGNALEGVDATYFAVISPDELGRIQQIFSSVNVNVQLRINANSQIQYNTSSAVAYNSPTNSLDTVSLETPAVIGYRLGARLDLYVNGGQIQRTDYNGSGARTFNQMARRANSAEYYNGVMGEILIIEGGISDAIADRINGYLAHKWRTVDTLPVNHPYKAAPPVV